MTQANMEQKEPTLEEIASFLQRWYDAWDRVYDQNRDRSACAALAPFLTEDATLVLLWGTLEGRDAVVEAVTKLQASGTTDRHRWEGFRVVTPWHVRSFVEFNRVESSALSMRVRVDVELVREQGELRIKSYHPAATTSEAAIRRMMEDYLAAFQRLDVAETERYYTIPSALMTPTGLIAFSSRQEVGGFLSQVFKQLKEKSYAKSAWLEMNVLPLGPSNAVVSAILARYDQNGAVIETSGATYHVALVSGEWKVAIGSAHPPLYVLQ
jgi:ketosteroid isomerase-like protein